MFCIRNLALILNKLHLLSVKQHRLILIQSVTLTCMLHFSTFT